LLFIGIADETQNYKCLFVKGCYLYAKNFFYHLRFIRLKKKEEKKKKRKFFLRLRIKPRFFSLCRSATSKVLSEKTCFHACLGFLGR
jgi:hypothetical protein